MWFNAFTRQLHKRKMDENSDNDRSLGNGEISNINTTIGRRGSNINCSNHQGISERNVIEIDPNVSSCRRNKAVIKNI